MFSVNLRKIATLALAGVFAASLSAGAMAETKWNRHHPRRHEVNHRLHNQNRRIDHAVRDGKMTHAQAAKLHREDHQIRREERRMAAKDGGHITKQDQQILNHQENQVSRQIQNQ